MTSFEIFLVPLYVLGCAVLLGAPFVPAWREWRRPSDSAPLPVPTDYRNESGHFARILRDRIVALANAADDPSSCGLVCAEQFGTPDGWNRANCPVVATEQVALATPVRCLSPVFATADFRTAPESSFTSIMADGQIDVGPGSQISEWVHARKALNLGNSSVALRRISSEEAVTLARDCCFERIQAPIVCFGTPRPDGTMRAKPVRSHCRLADLPGAQRQAEGVYRIDGECTLPAHCHYVGSLIVTGTLAIGAGTLIEGNVKAHKGVLLAPAARVLGSVVCEGAIHFLTGATADGPVISETEVLLGSGSRIGDSDAPSTVSAQVILAETGAVAHGTVWARGTGVVWGLG